jgi:hypothetical protein
MTSDFLTEKNERKLQKVLYDDICRRIGGDLNEKQATRLIKTVKYYMSEVNNVRGSTVGTNGMNKEVLSLTINDYMMYLNRKTKSSTRSAADDIEQGLEEDRKIVGEIEYPTERRLQDDVSTAFSQLQMKRQESRAKPPSPPDFRLALQEDGPVSLDMFEKIKQEREEEVRRQSLEQAQKLKTQQGQQNFMESSDSFLREKRKAEEQAENQLAERERQKLMSRLQTQTSSLPEPPDMRSLFLGDKQSLNRNAGNPTLAQPTFEREESASRQQMIITREPDTITYKETELNLFVYSGDRDWITNSSETRYNFTVNFDPANMPTGLRLNPTSTARFKNIVRIELVKAIMPGEGLDLLVSKSGDTAYDSALNMNILSYPYIQVRIPELDTNNFGTNQGLNASFGVLQYDANWIYDTSNSLARGFFAMIPKFLKCQKTYTPTPLATLQKLSFRFEKPDGTVLSSIPDTLDIKQVIPTLAMTAGTMTAGGALTNTVYEYDATIETNGSAYYWLQTTTYFNRWAVSKGDKINIKNLVYTGATGNALTQLQDILPFLQQDTGLFVVGTGVIRGTDTGTWVFADGYNSQGYANAILVRGKFVDPALTGGLNPASPGNIADSYTTGKMSYFLTNTAPVSGRILNQSHQVQIALRVIVREMDSTGILRPDNLY